MSRDFQTPTKHLNAVAAAATGAPIQLGYSGINGMTFHNVWTGTLGGTLKMEASCDPALTTAATAAEQDAANWVDITSQVTMTNPATGGGNDMVIVNNMRFWWVRLDLSSVTGTGTFSSYAASHGAG